MERSIPIAGAVLCGGGSRRMGTDKNVMSLEGEPLFARAARRLEAICDPVLLAAGGRDLPEAAWARISDDPIAPGPLGGVIAAIAASPHPLIAVVAADMPYVDPALISLLVRQQRGEGAVVPLSARGPEPLHAVYSVDAFDPLHAAAELGTFALHEALESVMVRYVTEKEWRGAGIYPRWTVNVNDPADAARLGITGDLPP